MLMAQRSRLFPEAWWICLYFPLENPDIFAYSGITKGYMSKPRKPTPSPLYFLGGHDLEMLEIRRMLEARGLEEGKDFFDRKLGWGAKLSDYQDLFASDRPNVCIELAEDIPPPPHYIRIDHHNERAERPSSLEQLAGMLGHSLSPYQQLVAANDRAYIAGMKELGASAAQIAEIRRKDRQAQGVTEAEEQQAEAAAQQAVQRGKVCVVRTGLSRFSPIADRLYEQPHLLIFNDHELTYYGPARDRLAAHYAAEVAAGKAYYGGESNGFFGFGKNAFHPPDTQRLVEEIVEIVNQA